MNKQMLYAAGICKLCGLEDGEHALECPGTLIESVRYEARYYGPNCGRGCCGYTEGEVEGGSVQEVFDKAADALAASEAITFRCDIRTFVSGVNDWPDITDAVNTRRRAQAEREEAARLAASKEAALKRLEAEKGDLTPEAYERRLAKILETS